VPPNSIAVARGPYCWRGCGGGALALPAGAAHLPLGKAAGAAASLGPPGREPSLPGQTKAWKKQL